VRYGREVNRLHVLGVLIQQDIRQLLALVRIAHQHQNDMGLRAHYGNPLLSKQVVHEGGSIA
jgi:hypothetical protein